jgi:hypothetical protein
LAFSTRRGREKIFVIFESRLVPISAENLQVLMRIAGLGIICWLVLRGRAKFRGMRQAKITSQLKHNANTSGLESTTFSGTQSIGAPAEVLRWQVELHDLGRDLKAELDSKLIAVREMTLRYDAAASRLKKLLEAAEQLHAHSPGVLEQIQTLSRQGQSNEQIAQSVGIPPEEVGRLMEMPWIASPK